MRFECVDEDVVGLREEYSVVKCKDGDYGVVELSDLVEI